MEYRRCSSCIPESGALTGYYQPGQLSPGFLASLLLLPLLLFHPGLGLAKAELCFLVTIWNMLQVSHECPVDKEELGRSTWTFLHTMTAYLPEKPSPQEQDKLSNFFQIFSRVYPCAECSQDFQKDIEKHPPQTKTRKQLCKWLCEAHNRVNVKLGKPKFDCSLVDERWRDGWKDGSCD
ncbi:GFER [Cordylochernes scorpioides]|uniref:Sulfhydryl oxidase n=1 Tax=Cordylochernes scorpioides TaxID=51811 RepID=A0ABY6LAI6_9ARAC|nr:GFER [Cordylochernes scorpioides]UYV78172.1 GFER [Cordylochernes scorpioides]